MRYINLHLHYITLQLLTERRLWADENVDYTNI